MVRVVFCLIAGGDSQIALRLPSRQKGSNGEVKQ